MRFLFCTTAGAGHLNPMVPFANACVSAGHEVLVASPPGIAGAVEDAGFAHWPLGKPSDEDLGRVFSQLPSLPHEQAEALVLAEIFGRLDAVAALPRLRRACETWKPDVVVREVAEFGSTVAAEVAGIPQVQVGISLAALQHLSIEHAAAPVDELRRSAGLDPDPDLRALRASPYLTLFPATLEDPDHPGPPGTHRFADPAWDQAPPTDGAHWWPEGDGPCVYVTFGSVAASVPMSAGAYRVALEAVAGLDARFLMTVGRHTEPDAFGPAPANVRIEPWVPQVEALAGADAVVGHGGSGTTIGALAAGLPQVVVPLFADQPHNAKRVEAVGAGLAVAPPEPEAVATAIGRVLAEPSFAAGARAIAAELRTQPPADEAVALLEAAGA